MHVSLLWDFHPTGSKDAMRRVRGESAVLPYGATADTRTFRLVLYI